MFAIQSVRKIIRNILNHHAFGVAVFVVLFGFFFIAGSLVVANGQKLGPNDNHVINLFVDGVEHTVPSRAKTVKDLLANTNITIYENDLVEPLLETEITTDNFKVNVYRARPVVIIDGVTSQFVMTPYKDVRTIADKAGFKTYSEDKVSIEDTGSFIREQTLAQKLIITRATPVIVSLYGAPVVTYRTHSKSVFDVLKENDIVPEAGATVIPSMDSLVKPNMLVFIAKPGKTVSVSEEKVPYETESTPDPSKPIGAITVLKPGVPGRKQVVYELTLRSGREVNRKKIQEVITEQPQKQLQAMGTKLGTGLSKAKGAGVFIDSRGVIHRETYYDLPMASVMRSCGAGGNYSVRAADGAKVDKDGFVIIAANLNNYPRCSVVETSMGPGKVYDTGGFAFVHPHAFDLATDWTNYDGR